MEKTIGSFKGGECIAPVGLTLPHAKRRLKELPQEMRRKDPEHIIMRLWAKENTRRFNLNFGKVPIDNILHKCTKKCGKRRTFAGSPSHDYVPPNVNEVRIINATIQWIATNCGRAFLHEFQQELKKLHQD
jgi:hypothetical protein